MTTSPAYPVLPSRTSYHPRVSPPGSPSSKAQCYEHKNQVYISENVFCCCYPCLGTKSTSILATIGVCLLVLSYTLLGAFVFMALEGGFDGDNAVAATKHKTKTSGVGVVALRSHTVDRLWSITENLNILYKENWTKLAAEEVLEFQEALVRTMRNEGGGESYVGDGFAGNELYYHAPSHRWSFSSSFLYSLTLITTIDQRGGN